MQRCSRSLACLLACMCLAFTAFKWSAESRTVPAILRNDERAASMLFSVRRSNWT